MLDRLYKGIINKLDAATAVVATQRADLERERAGDVARPYAGIMLKNSEGHSTALRAAAQNSQKEYARLRREWEELGQPAMALMGALAVARERRDETREAFLQHEKDEAHRVETGVHLDIRAFFAAMFEHGVQPRHLAKVRPEMVAIVSDLIRWDGHDPKTSDPDSPLALVFGIYANRSMLKPGQAIGEPRSVPGAPPSAVLYTDPVYYVFDELIPKAVGGFETAFAETPRPDGDHVKVDLGKAGIIDASNYQTGSSPLTLGIEPGNAPVPDKPPPLTPAQANAYAERIADHRMAAYWPEEGGEYRSYDMDKLLPALRRLVDSGKAPVGVALFLDEASNGRAREFFEDARQRIVAALKTRLEAGDDRALAEARSLNLPV